MSGQDSLLSIVQMPAGVPVGTLAIGEAGAVNAALLACAVLALSDEPLAARLEAWRAERTASVAERPDDAEAAMILSPGATIGILGGGQLGRMLAIAALKVGLRTHIYAPESEAPAYDAAGACTVAPFNDEEALKSFAAAVDVVTYEFENVPTETVEFLAERLPVRPGVKALALTQDRLIEKTFLRDLGLKTAPFVGVEDAGAPGARRRRARPAGDPEDPPLRLRRQGPVADPGRLQRFGGPSGARRRADDPRGLRRLRARSLGRRGAQPRGRCRRLRPQRERARAAYPGAHSRAGAHRLETALEAKRIATTVARGARLRRRAGGRIVRDA